MRKLLFWMIILIILDCCLGGYIGFWREKFWNSVSQKHYYDFCIYIIQFTVVALVDTWAVSYYQYLGNLISLTWRTKLTNIAITTNKYSNIEGGSQRIQEDCNTYPMLFISLLTGMTRSMIMIFVFGYILLSHLSWIYLLFPLVYSVIGTGIAGLIAYPLLGLNYMNQVWEAKFRHVLQEQSEAILTYQQVYKNNFTLYKWTKYLAYFQNFYSQVTVIVPYLGLSGLYFSSKITFGIFMQVASSMIEIINNLSYIISSFNDINKWLSCRKRLRELEII